MLNPLDYKTHFQIKKNVTGCFKAHHGFRTRSFLTGIAPIFTGFLKSNKRKMYCNKTENKKKCISENCEVCQF